MASETQSMAAPAAAPRPGKRHASRAGSTYGAFLARLRNKGFSSNEDAERAALAVLCALEQRLNTDESCKLQSQLPSLLVELLLWCEQHAHPRPRDIGRREFFDLVNEHFPDRSIDTEQSVRAVFEAIAEQVTPGETHKIIQQLPRHLRGLWPEWARAAEERRQPLPPHAPEVTTERATDAVDRVLALALPAQLGVLRTIAPKILARLDDDARRGFVRDLDTEIFLALQGVPTYDLRHGRAP